jgi:hypothetical protein
VKCEELTVSFHKARARLLETEYSVFALTLSSERFSFQWENEPLTRLFWGRMWESVVKMGKSVYIVPQAGFPLRRVQTE